MVLKIFHFGRQEDSADVWSSGYSQRLSRRNQALTGPQPAPGRLAGSHLIGVCVVGGGRILSLRLIHGALCCPHGCILGRLLHVRVLPCSRGPLLLSFAETPPAAPVEFMDL